MSALASAWTSASVFVLGFFVLIWVVSVFKKDASIVDIFWGLGFVLLAWTAAWRPIADGVFGSGAFEPAPRQWLGLALVTIWGVRLAGYIGWRNRGHDEDYRYQAMRKRVGKAFVWRSLVTVFLLQGALVLLIGAPHVVLQSADLPADHGWVWSDVLAVLLFAVGIYFEAVGDWQMARFKADPANKGKVMDRGVWAYTRHPNYFGDAVCWWSFFVLALGVPGGLWTLPAPILMTILLLKVSGVALLEKTIVERRPEYADYIARTNAFIPGPRRSA